MTHLDTRTLTRSRQYASCVHDRIPGGAHTYSKGDDQFPANAPAAIERGHGALVWDVDGNEYLDCSMGLTSVGLGHAYEAVLARVREELGKGVNFQRPSHRELEAAERFLSLVPQHDMIKFAKNGSTVTTAAVKLARAKTGRRLVAFPGNHPFYSYDDWFIGRTACSKGVPEEVANLSVTFTGCDIDSLEALFRQYPDDIACVITEPERSTCTADCKCGGRPGAFLEAAIALAHRYGALFIIDEMITGFKSGWPGSIAKFGLRPDMATWGKGIANGFAFCALTGTRDVMELGGIRRHGQEKVFLISSTHGAETHTLVAALATIDEYERHNVIARNHATGTALIGACRQAVSEAGLTRAIELTDCPWMVLFTFRNATGVPCPSMRTLVLQEMIARGVLFQGAFVPCFSHDAASIDRFVAAFREVLPVYARALNEGVAGLLVGPAVKPVFRKYIECVKTRCGREHHDEPKEACCVAAGQPLVRVRPATQDDAERVWRWRNDDAARQASFSDAMIPLADHLTWFTRALDDDSRLLLVGESDHGEVGYVRFDFSETACTTTVSIAVDPAHRGRGYASVLLRGGVALARQRWPAGEPVAFVKPDNRASRQAFESAGFVVVALHDDRLELRLETVS